MILSSPLRARSHFAIPGLLLLSLAGCDRGGGPLEAGRYLYRAAHVGPGGEDTIRLEGMLEVEEARGDTIEGSWSVPQLHPELRVIEGEDGKLTVTAHPTYFGTIHHDISRVGRGIACSGEYVWVAEGGVERSMPLTCSITTADEGTPPPGLEAVESPIVRPTEGDTADPG